jgi:hypothetical protein
MQVVNSRKSESGVEIRGPSISHSLPIGWNAARDAYFKAWGAGTFPLTQADLGTLCTRSNSKWQTLFEIVE